MKSRFVTPRATCRGTAARLLAALLTAAVALAGPDAARAHDLWLERDGDTACLRYGHLPGGHGGARTLPLGAGRILAVFAFDAEGRPAAVTALPPDSLCFRGEAAALFVATSSGWWTKTIRGTRNLPKDAVEHPLKSWRSFESVKRLDAWGEALARPLTDRLELTPLADPLALRPGDKLRLLVTRGGEPVAGATVAYDGSPRGATGEDGRVNLRIRHGGLQLVQASLVLPLNSPHADEAAYATALVFELPDTEGD